MRDSLGMSATFSLGIAKLEPMRRLFGGIFSPMI
jgi:hypothetical protein